MGYYCRSNIRFYNINHTITMLDPKQVQLVEDALLALLNSKIEEGEIDNDEQEKLEESINDILLIIKSLED